MPPFIQKTAGGLALEDVSAATTIESGGELFNF